MSDVQAMNSGYELLKVMVVDDDQFSCTYMKKNLNAIGVRNVSTAQNGAQALKLMTESSQPFNLIFSDLNMGPINGLELLKVIRIGYGNIDRATRLVVFSGLVDMGLVPPALGLDVNGFLEKPVAQARLKESIDHAFNIDFLLQGSAVYNKVAVPATADLEEIAERSGLKPLPSLTVPGAPQQTAPDEERALPPIVEQAFQDGRIREVIPTPNLAGHILARDIVADGGRLLLAAGVELSAGLLRHIVSLQRIDKSLGVTIAVVINEQSDDAQA